MEDAKAPPVLTPVAPPPGEAPRGRGAGLAVAVVLALCVVAGSVLALFPSRPPPPPPGPPRFGAATGERLARLRDRLATGLLSLRGPDGTFAPRARVEGLDPVAVTEATAMALAGLSAARRTGFVAPGLDAAIHDARLHLGRRQDATRSGSFGAPLKRNWGTEVVTLSASILALSLAGAEADAPRLARAAEALAHESSLGAFPDGWTRAVAARAVDALRRSGRAALLGADPAEVVRVKADPGKVRDWRDPRVAEAVSRRVRAPDDLTDPYPAQILAKAVETGWDWGDDRTDLSSWTMTAWLAARTPGGDAWFAGVLPSLEAAPDEAGVIQGDVYGDPVSRTACALLILYEGWTSTSPDGP